jgi:undecaprenyl-phosphate 4-deoxy-4-formamido-L-arabinose transferase
MAPDRETHRVSIPRCDLSVVIPVYNEENNLGLLHQRLETTLLALGRSFEVIYVDDGSTDRSLEILTRLGRTRAGSVRVVELYRNYGQFAAIAAGFGRARGAIVVTLDSDLQNPPEEIPKLVAKIEEGYDVVNGWRKDRRDSTFRRLTSRLVNRIARAAGGPRVRDHGCMLRAYRWEVAQQIAACQERSPYVPTLANSLARRVAEIEVEHSKRSGGRSKYTLARLIDLQYNMLATYSARPLRALSLSGLGLSAAAIVLGGLLALRRLFAGPEGGWTPALFMVLFFLIGLLFVALGLVGELVGRIYDVSRQQPRFVVRRVHGDAEGDDASTTTADDPRAAVKVRDDGVPAPRKDS